MRLRLGWLRVLPLGLSRYPREGDALSPLRDLPAAELAGRLLSEHVLAELMRAGTESFASEHGALLLAIGSAWGSMDAKQTELSRLAAQLRQDEITTELLDVVTGAEALRTTP